MSFDQLFKLTDKLHDIQLDINAACKDGCDDRMRELWPEALAAAKAVLDFRIGQCVPANYRFAGVDEIEKKILEATPPAELALIGLDPRAVEVLK